MSLGRRTSEVVEPLDVETEPSQDRLKMCKKKKKGSRDA